MEHQPNQSWPLPLTPESHLDFKADLLSVEVRGMAPGETPRVEVRGADGDRIDISVREDSGTVKVRTRVREDGWWGGRGDARVSLIVPPAISANLHTHAGSFDIRGLENCRLDASADAGRVRLDDVHGRLRLRSDAGQIAGKRLSGRFDVRTDAGSLKLSIDGLEPGEHRFHADVGSIRLELAPNLPVHLELRVEQGSVDSRVGDEPDAAATLRVSTDMGSIKIRRTDGEEDEPRRGGRFRYEMRGRGRGPMPPVPPIPPIPPIPPLPHFRSFFGWDQDDAQREQRGEVRPRAYRPSPRPAAPPRPVDPEVERILTMVEKGELSATDADVLLRAMEHE